MSWMHCRRSVIPADRMSCLWRFGANKQITAAAFRLKGSGWYETDFKRDKDKRKNLHQDAEPAKEKPAGDKPKEKAAAGAKPKSDAPAAKPVAKESPKPKGGRGWLVATAEAYSRAQRTCADIAASGVVGARDITSIRPIAPQSASSLACAVVPVPLS
jgi:hypothetical protein